MWELVLLCCGHHQDSVVSLVIIDVSNVSVRVRWTAGRVPMKPFLQIQGCDCLVHPYHEVIVVYSTADESLNSLSSQGIDLAGCYRFRLGQVRGGRPLLVKRGECRGGWEALAEYVL